jgi:hypothetical protein
MPQETSRPAVECRIACTRYKRSGVVRTPLGGSVGWPANAGQDYMAMSLPSAAPKL